MTVPPPDEKVYHRPAFARDVAEVVFPRRVAFAFYALLFLAGIIVYLAWGFAYGSWNLFAADWVGVYAVTVVLVGFGIVGMLLYRE